MTAPIEPSHPLWADILGSIGAAVFYGRFYVQWIVSEIRKKSVIPVAFWYMSGIGSLFLFLYGVIIHSPMGTLSQTFNSIVYARNLTHIWREQGKLSPTRDRLFQIVTGLVVLIALSLTLYTWYIRWRHPVPGESVRRTWIWVAVGLVGQGLFAGRFLLQWLATEMKKKSVVPVAFWYMSVFAASLMALSFAQLHEWVYSIGLVATIFIYVRNLWLIHAGEGERIFKK